MVDPRTSVAWGTTTTFRVDWPDGTTTETVRDDGGRVTETLRDREGAVRELVITEIQPSGELSMT